MATAERVLLDTNVLVYAAFPDSPQHAQPLPLVNWSTCISRNVRHVANPNKMEHLRRVCARLGLLPPQIFTPEFLWETEQ